jgi:DNA-binding SARP family transcriptional activator
MAGRGSYRGSGQIDQESLASSGVQGQPAENTARDAELPGVRIRLLGGFEILKNGRPVPLRQGGKVEQLIGALALRPRDGVSREVLIETVWPESDRSLGGHSLNSLAHWLKLQLRDALGGRSPVRHDGGRYALALSEQLSLDVLEFEQCVELGHRCASTGDLDAAAGAYEEALELYAGDLMAGSDVLFLLERERLRARYLSVMAGLAEQCYASGRFREALQHALGLLYADPCREDAHRMVMRSYVRDGQRAQALRHFETCRVILRREFDAVPEPETVALFEIIRTDPQRV